MTNSMNDIRHAKSIMIVGENICTSHPIAMQHVLTARERGARVSVIDPRFSKTAAFAHDHYSIRQGTDVALIYGLINVIFENGWEDKEMLRNRTYGLDYVKKEMRKRYDLETVSNVTGLTIKQIRKLASTIAKNRPGTLIWAMGGTQHSNGTSVTRSFCMLQLVLGNMGKSGGGTNVFRGHDNVQGVTDLGVLSNTLPGYYGLSAGAYTHWSRVWGVKKEWMFGRFKDKKMLSRKGFTVGRWYEGVLMDPNNLGQDTNVNAVFYWGHSINSQSQMDRVKTALEKVELLVDIDPFVTITSTLPDRQDGAYMLPAATIYEQPGTVTNSNRDIQWRNEVVKPLEGSRTDLQIILDMANRLGFGKEFAKSGGTINKPWDTSSREKLVESIAAEWADGMRTIGMVGQTVKRLKRQQRLAHTFNIETKRAEGGKANGEQWGLPWPCWTDKHPGSQILYNIDIPVAEGGMGFRARWGAAAKDDKRSLLAGAGSAPVGSAIKGGYVEGKGEVDGKKVNWKTDLSGKIYESYLSKGLAPYGNGRARMRIWGWDDQVPTHREPIHTPRPDLISKFPTYEDIVIDKKNGKYGGKGGGHYRLPTAYKSLQLAKWAKEYPVTLNTGRQAEFEGGGNAERAMWWLVELQPEMYAEIHPKLANDLEIRHGDWMWIESPEDFDGKPSKVKVKAKVTRRVPDKHVYLPFHWGGTFEGKDFTDKFPDGFKPYGVGESANVVTNYGYDRITQMQETKGGLCRIKKA